MPDTTEYNTRMHTHRLPTLLRNLSLTLGGVLLLTLSLFTLKPVLQPANLVLCYVPLVLIVAIRFGRTTAVAASIASFLAYNFFFVPPLYTLAIELRQDLLELAIFLAGSLIIGTLADRERAQSRAVQLRMKQMKALYQLSQEVSRSTNYAQILPHIAATARTILGASGVTITLTLDEQQVPLIARAGVPDSGPGESIPISAGGQTVGFVQAHGLARSAQDQEPVLPLLTMISNLVALMVERTRATDAAMHTLALQEADRLKSVLLSSVSHDLRTPLAVITGAASNLLDPTMSWDAGTQRAFAEAIASEADRLNRLVRNLLEMSRLEAGAFRRQRVPTEIGELLGETVQRLTSYLREYRLEIEIAPDLPLVLVDAVQIDLVLSNLLENAAKFAPPQTGICVTARQIPGFVEVTVADQGPGVPAAMQERIFEKFYRGAPPEHGPGGSGLGLTICQGIVEAHGGRIWVENRPEGGLCVHFTLPAPENVAVAAEQRSESTT
ncbi:MAG TPA: ATP-binding protein [Herpetosiphonaceae bacterium]